MFFEGKYHVWFISVALWLPFPGNAWHTDDEGADQRQNWQMKGRLQDPNPSLFDFKAYTRARSRGSVCMSTPQDLTM